MDFRSSGKSFPQLGGKPPITRANSRARPKARALTRLWAADAIAIVGDVADAFVAVATLIIFRQAALKDVFATDIA